MTKTLYVSLSLPRSPIFYFHSGGPQVHTLQLLKEPLRGVPTQAGLDCQSTYFTFRLVFELALALALALALLPLTMDLRLAGGLTSDDFFDELVVDDVRSGVSRSPRRRSSAGETLVRRDAPGVPSRSSLDASSSASPLRLYWKGSTDPWLTSCIVG